MLVIKRPSDKSGKNKDDQRTNLEIKLDAKNFVIGNLKNRKKLNILVDSGSSLTLVSENFVSDNNILANCKKTAVNPVKFTVGNGGILLSKEKICFDVYVPNVKIRLNAYAVKSLIGVELILGNEVLSDLGGILDFEARIVRLKDKKNILSPVRKYVIYPGQSCHVALKGKFPQLQEFRICYLHDSKIGKIDCYQCIGSSKEQYNYHSGRQ